jgi:hypothetical protein
MAKNFDLVSVIVCEDVRTEMGGKQSAYGLFDSELICASFPAILPKLVFRVTLRLHKRPAKKVKFIVSSADGRGHKLFEYDGKFPEIAMHTSSKNMALLFAAIPVMVPIESHYSLRIAIDDGPLKTIWGFDFRLPKGDDEKARLPSV